jgi:hypothetical protein
LWTMVANAIILAALVTLVMASRRVAAFPSLQSREEPEYRSGGAAER